MMGFLEGLRLDTLLKRVCKSLLKKRLGDLILGDLDLDQFDIQLGRGTLQLNDLALNAEFVNRKVRFLSAPPACSRDSRVFFSHVCWVGGRRCPLSIGSGGRFRFCDGSIADWRAHVVRTIELFCGKAENLAVRRGILDLVAGSVSYV
jgi:hypothetical protein